MITGERRLTSPTYLTPFKERRRKLAKQSKCWRSGVSKATSRAIISRIIRHSYRLLTLGLCRLARLRNLLLLLVMGT